MTYTYTYLVICILFAEQHLILFNAVYSKTQLIKFYKSVHPVSSSRPCFLLLGETLSLRNSVCHLGHILSFNLSDDEDIFAISRDMCRKANYILHVFSCCDPIVCSLEIFLSSAQGFGGVF